MDLRTLCKCATWARTDWKYDGVNTQHHPGCPRRFQWQPCDLPPDVKAGEVSDKVIVVTETGQIVVSRYHKSSAVEINGAERGYWEVPAAVKDNDDLRWWIGIP